MSRLATIVIIVCAGAALAAGQKPRPEQLRVVEMSGVEMGALLATLALDCSVTIGFEADPNRPRSPIELHLRDVNCRQVIEGTVKAEPRYQLRESKWFMEVLPAKAGLSFLDTPIGSFQLNDVTRELAVNRVFGLPAVQAQALAMNLKVRTPLPPAEGRNEKLSFDFSGMTLRQALNRIAEDSGAKFWSARKFPDGTYEIKLACC